MNTKRKAFLAVAAVVLLSLAGCKGHRTTASGLIALGTSEDICHTPNQLLQQKAARDYWRALDRAFRLAERTGREEGVAAPKLQALADQARYASGVRGLIAGQGGYVKRAGYSSNDVREAVKSLSSEPRAEVASMIAEAYAAAAKHLKHRTCEACECAADKLAGYSSWWQELL